ALRRVPQRRVRRRLQPRRQQGLRHRLRRWRGAPVAGQLASHADIVSIAARWPRVDWPCPDRRWGSAAGGDQVAALRSSVAARRASALGLSGACRLIRSRQSKSTSLSSSWAPTWWLSSDNWMLSARSDSLMALVVRRRLRAVSLDVARGAVGEDELMLSRSL